MKLAIIGGSLFTNLDALSQVVEEKIKTPFGSTSANIITGKLDDFDIVYLNRHGVNHQIAPHQINYKANMFALKLLNVTHVISIAAVGGITDKMSPMKCVLADQLIDYSYGRLQTYNDGSDNEVNHIDFTYPFDAFLRNKIKHAAIKASIDCLTEATYGVTQGPRLETIAEINKMQQDGCDIVGMTAMPEAALARELEMGYANLSLVVNWAAGAGSSGINTENQVTEVISMDEIKQRISDGNKIIEAIISNTVSLLI